MANQQFNLGPLILILILSGLVLRYFFVTPGAQPRTNDPQAALRDREEAAQRILQIFPHVDRRSILWDLQRTGGNVNATTERILTGRLATPPITFQPPPPPGSSNTAPSQPSHAEGVKPADFTSQPDLITRYNLQGKLTAATMPPEAESSTLTGKKGKAWSTNKDERQAALQKRREDMILAARRKMEAKLAAGKNASTSASGN